VADRVERDHSASRGAVAISLLAAEESGLVTWMLRVPWLTASLIMTIPTLVRLSDGRHPTSHNAQTCSGSSPASRYTRARARRRELYGAQPSLQGGKHPVSAHTRAADWDGQRLE
jgi:hypothetical protein